MVRFPPRTENNAVTQGVSNDIRTIAASNTYSPINLGRILPLAAALMATLQNRSGIRLLIGRINRDNYITIKLDVGVRIREMNADSGVYKVF